jgi:DNA polymerase III subunit epsilon
VSAWHERTIVGLDCEATGVDPATARMLEVAVAIDRPGEGCELLLDTLVDPGPAVAIPEEASAIHGITRARLEAENAPPPAEVLPTVLDILHRCAASGDCVLIFNALYDWRLLAAELARLDPPLALPECHLVDPMVLDRHVDRYRRGRRTLPRACEVYGVDLTDAHRAAADVVAACEVMREMARRYPEELDASPGELFALQVEAHRSWRDRYNDWRAGEGLAPIPEHEWPGVPALA